MADPQFLGNGIANNPMEVMLAQRRAQMLAAEQGAAPQPQAAPPQMGAAQSLGLGVMQGSSNLGGGRPPPNIEGLKRILMQRALQEQQQQQAQQQAPGAMPQPAPMVP